MTESTRDASGIESSYAWFRLGVSIVLMTIGGASLYAVVVVMPPLQAEFGIARAGASLPFTATMIGFALGGLVTGRMVDRFGIVRPILAGAAIHWLGFTLASRAPDALSFTLAQGMLIGFGGSATFSPLLADISHWFARRRGLAVALCASGNYVGGALWPSLTQHLVATHGWRQSYELIGFGCLLAIVPLALCLRRPAPIHAAPAVPAMAAGSRSLATQLSPTALQALLCIAGVACCVAMSMPQVHLVALCADAGYGPARGAEMLSLMLGCGIVSRLASGFVADRIGGLRTLLISGALQGVALLLFLPAKGLVSLYVVSGLFGLFQGGIVPSYAIIIREYFPAAEAGRRVAAVVTATLAGMALGSWMSGAIYDVTGSYTGAFLNGIGWNLLNVTIGVFLLTRLPPRGVVALTRA